MDDESTKGILAPATPLPAYQSDDVLCNHNNFFVSARMVGTMLDQREKISRSDHVLQPRI